jgi:hypothetical protein
MSVMATTGSFSLGRLFVVPALTAIGGLFLLAAMIFFSTPSTVGWGWVWAALAVVVMLAVLVVALPLTRASS